MRGFVNADAYYDRYSDIQRRFQYATTSQNTVFVENVAAATLQGLEVEATLAPGEQWQTSLSYSYNEARYTDWISSDPFSVAKPGSPSCLPSSPAGECLLDLRHNAFPQMPRNKLNVSVRYTVPIDASFGELSALLSVFTQSENWLNEGSQRAIELAPTTGFSNSTIKKAISEPAFTTLNARIDWLNVRGSHLDLSLFGNNLTDETYATNGINQLYSLGFADKIYADPRLYGVELVYRFGD
jgi:outer membrane receptor protein involved in Fe transport